MHMIGGREGPQILSLFIKIDATEVTKPCWSFGVWGSGGHQTEFRKVGGHGSHQTYRFKGFGAMEVTKPCRFMWCGATDFTT